LKIETIHRPIGNWKWKNIVWLCPIDGGKTAQYNSHNKDLAKKIG
jgi:hypothetical protein